MEGSMLRALARDAELVGPVVIAAESNDRALANVRAMVRRQRIAVLQMQDPARVASYVAARDTPLVIVVAATPHWGLGTVASVRRASATPIVVAGVTPSPDELLELLGAGANLVVDGAAGEREIRSRIVGLYSAATQESREGLRWLECDGMRTDLFSRTCSVDDRAVRLSRMEYQLLLFLMTKAQQTIAPEEIVRRVWGWNDGNGLNSLRIHIGRLRRKLGDDARAPRFIASLRGAGYQFVQPVAHVANDTEGSARGDNEVLLEARLQGMYEALAAASDAGDLVDMSRRAMEAVIGSNQCDAAAIFQHDRDQSRLVASAGTPSGWDAVMSRGHRLSGQFVSGEAATVGNVVQIADIRLAAKRYPASAMLMTSHGQRSCLVVPLKVGGEVWGDVGFVRRQPRAFTPQQTTYLRAITDLMALSVPSFGSG
jgi:DNA-binding response OmpR family regulator